jgi:type VI secretion system secreted protein Hcp
MAIDLMLEIEGVEGETKDKQLPKGIEISGYGLSGEHPHSASAGTGHATGQVHLGELHVQKTMDKSSPVLFKYMNEGKHFTKVTLHCRKAVPGSGQQDFYTITLNEVFVTAYSENGGGGSDHLPNESWSFSYTKIKKEYKPQKEDGSLGASSPVSYDVKAREAA